MDWTLIIVFQVFFQPSLSVLFTVDAEKTVYNSEFGGDVVMGCRFQPKTSGPDAELKVTWLLVGAGATREVYQYQRNKGTEPSTSQEYVGRVQLLTSELQEGWAKLQISRLRINDSGTYQCLVQTGEGADYKTISLSVTAPYSVVTKRVERTPEGAQVLLTCLSEGYPSTSVVWQDGRRQAVTPSSTSDVATPDRLLKVTSQIRVSSTDRSNYTCSFTNDGHSATFYIPDEVPAADKKRDALVVGFSVGLVMAAAAAAAVVVVVLLYRRRKGFRTVSKRDLLVEGRVRPAAAAACPQVRERTIFGGDRGEENLKAFLKGQYSEFQCTDDVEELRHRLHNNDGQPVNLQALIPEAGETVFVEGAPGSGKTSTACMLVSSWSEGPTHTLSKLLDLNGLQLVLYLDCSAVKGDLFEEITTQLALKENMSTDNELRTMLTGSSETLLLLDGYREGNAFFDQSLKRFLSDSGGHRVLVMTSQEHCPLLEETARTTRVLRLQNKMAKY